MVTEDYRDIQNTIFNQPERLLAYSNELHRWLSLEQTTSHLAHPEKYPTFINMHLVVLVSCQQDSVMR